MLRNYILDRLDRVAWKRELPEDTATQVPDEKHGPEALMEQTELAGEMLSMLSPREAECLRLRANGCSYEEIGDVLGIRLGTVGALLARAYKKLREPAGSQPGIATALSFLMRGGETHSV